MKLSEKTSIAIVYDWLDKWGGIERVLLNLKDIFPQAIFFSSYQNTERAAWSKKFNVRTSFINSLPPFIKNSRLLSMPFYPFAFESFDFTSFNIVLSVSSSFAKSIITRPETLHICYLLTPTRFLFNDYDIYLKNSPAPYFSKFYLERLKKWDIIASSRPDFYISISKNVSARIKKCYKKDSTVIYPPFDIDYWNGIKLKAKSDKIKIEEKDFFLIVSRLEPYKRVELAIEVFNKLYKNLIVVGTGSQENKLKKMAKSNIVFKKNLSDLGLATLYQNAQALIMPQEEDFGMVSLEAQFFGLPIIAYKSGGAMETVIENKTGICFPIQDHENLARAIEKFEKMSYTLKQSTKIDGQKNTSRFSSDKFRTQILNFISSVRNI